MADLENRLVSLSNAVNIFCEYLLKSLKKNNSDINSLNNNVIGYFKRPDKYGDFYNILKDFAQNEISINNICNVLCDIFFVVAETSSLNGHSFSVINLLLQNKFSINKFELNDDYRSKLENVKRIMLIDFNIYSEENTNNNIEANSNSSDTPHIHVNSNLAPNIHTQIICDTQRSINSVPSDSQTALLLNSLNNSSDNNNSLALLSFLNNLSESIKIINENIVNNSKNTNEKFKHFAKLVNSNSTVKEYFDKINHHTKNILWSENQIKILRSYKDASHTPLSLRHSRFPRPMFNQSTFQDYFLDYNKAIETCQNSLIDINIAELERRIAFSKNEVSRFRDILSISDDKVVDKIKDIESTIKKGFESSFKKSNEACNRHIQEPIDKYPLVKEKNKNSNFNNNSNKTKTTNQSTKLNKNKSNLKNSHPKSSNNNKNNSNSKSRISSETCINEVSSSTEKQNSIIDQNISQIRDNRSRFYRSSSSYSNSKRRPNNSTHHTNNSTRQSNHFSRQSNNSTRQSNNSTRQSNDSTRKTNNTTRSFSNDQVFQSRHVSRFRN